MLRFYRKAFKSGIMKVTEKWTVDGVEQVKNWGFKPNDNGKVFEFTAPEYILEKYGAFFSVPE